MPEFELEDVEDYYTYYVQILGMSEEVFWYADLSFVKGIAANKSAYDAWYNYEIEKERKRNE